MFTRSVSFLKPLSRIRSVTFLQNSIRPITSNSVSTKVPITVLSGFLGSGKSTFISNVISKKDASTNIGILVNDVASVNIDAKLLHRQKVDGIDIIEMQDGCICCSISDDLLGVLDKLVSSKNINFDHILIEGSGVAEPRKIRDLFQDAENNNIALLDKIYLDTFITVVDSTTFYGLAKSDKQTTSTVSNYIIPNAMNLLIEQVEVADLILVNKCDLLDTNVDEKIETISTFIANINPTAKIISCVNSNVEEQSQYLCYSEGRGVASFGILDEHKHLLESAKPLLNQNDHHNHDDNHHHHDNQNTLGIGTFVYQRRRPLHPQRFSSFLKSLDKISWKRISDLGGLYNRNDINSSVDNSETFLLKRPWTSGSSLFRVKGFVWIASSSVTAYYMSYAGGSLELSQLGKWWSAIPRNDWPEVYVDDIEKEFEGTYGDRRQEIVFIYSFGNDESKAKTCLENALDDCLLTEEEMKEYKHAPDDIALRKVFL